MKLVRNTVLAVGLLVLAVSAPACSRAEAAAPVVTMYKTPTCGCCGAWADHMRQNGYSVKQVIRADLSSIRERHDVPGHMLSCHTSVIDGYAVEGHVPAEVVARLLEERPAVAGIAVPRMPLGSPGMEQLSGRREPYEVFTFERGGATAVYEVRVGPGS